jgi:hypothetical protein
MSEFATHLLLQTPTVAVRDVVCAGTHRHLSDEERSGTTELVLSPIAARTWCMSAKKKPSPMRARFLIFNRGESYRVSHPNPGGDASLAIGVDEALLQEIAPKHLLREGDAFAFRPASAAQSTHAHRCWSPCSATACAKASPNRSKAKASH